MATRSAQSTMKESTKKATAGKTARTSSIPKKAEKVEASTEKKTSANFTEEQVNKMIDEVKNKKQKAKILKENGIHVKEAETEKAWERFMQELLEKLRGKGAASKGKGKAQPRATGAAESSGSEEEESEGGVEEKGSEDEWEEEAEESLLRRMKSAASKESSPMKTIVVPSGGGRGLRLEGNGKRTKVDLSWLAKPLEASLGGMGGNPAVLLPGLAGLKPEDLKNLGEVALKGYEILDREGRMKVDVLMRAGLSLRSLAVVASIVAILQTSGKDGKLFAIGSPSLDGLLCKLEDLRHLRDFREKRSRDESPTRHGGRGEGGGGGSTARDLCEALASNMLAGGLTMEQERRAAQLWAGKKAAIDWNEEDRSAVQASLTSEHGAGLLAKRSAAAAAAEAFQGSESAACLKILGGGLTDTNAKAVVKAAAGLPKGKVMDGVGLGRAAAMIEQLTRSVQTHTYEGTKKAVGQMIEGLNGFEEQVVQEGAEDVEDFFMEFLLRRQTAQLTWAAGGFRGEREVVRGLNEEDKRKWALLEASLKCDQRNLKKAKREEASKGDKWDPRGQSDKAFGSGDLEYCGHFLKGNCQRADCPNAHIEKKDIPCAFLRKGSCFKGSKCDWKH